MAKVSKALLLTALMMCSLLHAQASEMDSPALEEPLCNAERSENWTVGLIQCNDNLSAGYTLFSPMSTTTSYLIDHNGQEVHAWTSPGGHRPGMSAYLLDDGSLLRPSNIAQTAVGNFSGGGTAGKVERISWEGDLLWSYEYSSTEYISHHDIEPMPNGNLLMIAWESKTDEQGRQAGRNPAIASDAPGGSNGVWPDKIVEIQPNGTTGGDVVWSWHAWDHLVQDYDPSKDNYGVVADHPELLDINFVDAAGAQAGKADWMHCNGIDYNPLLDQIALSCKNTNEIYIIDHSTTTEEAAGHSGGARGKGGDFLYRWGNPEAYDMGTYQDKRLYSQHDVQWIEEDRPGAGSLIVYNNGVGRAGTYSSVDVITPVILGGEYQMDGEHRFLPNTPSWSWDNGAEMYAPFVSGAQRLANGNTLVTYGTNGTLYEVTLNGEIAWTYISPVSNQGIIEQGEAMPDGNVFGSKANTIFKVRKYTADHSGFSGRDLTPGSYIEPWTDLCPEADALPWDRDGDGCIDDSDQDGVLDPEDQCPGFDDNVDADADGVIDGCDEYVDADEDGVEDSMDECLGYDDSIDVDGDGTPDGCDALIDSDGDGAANAADACEGHNDTLDVDLDGIPDGCDGLDDRTTSANYAVNTTYEPMPQTVDEGSGLLHVTVEFAQLVFTPGTIIEYSITTLWNGSEVASGEHEMVPNGSNDTHAFAVEVPDPHGGYCAEVELRLPNNQTVLNQNEFATRPHSCLQSHLLERNITDANGTELTSVIYIEEGDGQDCPMIAVLANGSHICWAEGGNEANMKSDVEPRGSLPFTVVGVVLLTMLLIGFTVRKSGRSKN